MSAEEHWLTSKNFWIATGERAIKTLAQAVAAPVVLGLAKGVGLIDLNWLEVVSTAGAMTLLSVLMSIISSARGSKDSPSLTESK